MELTCGKCGHTAKRVDFRHLNYVDSTATTSWRQCPQCRAAVFSEDVEDADDFATGRVWGTSRLRGQVFRRERGHRRHAGEGRDEQ
ncbi:MAG: hypothetical protein ACLFOY_08880 [Desulfatibacillaceae bacterium]